MSLGEKTYFMLCCCSIKKIGYFYTTLPYNDDIAHATFITFAPLTKTFQLFPLLKTQSPIEKNEISKILCENK
jgi:hypothetical protein